MTVRNPIVWKNLFSELPSGDQLQVDDGAVGAPGLVFRGSATSGLYYAASSVRVSVGGVLIAGFSSTGLVVTGTVGATTSVSAGTSVLAGSFVNAGTLFSINSNTVIDANRLHLLRNYAVAALPAAAPDGAIAFATDSTQTLTAGIGTPVVGLGANKVPVYSAGGVWIIG